ncbi:4Fe-4S binding protein [candidate division KSB1 bacterium]|nr:4Fe-4S binding protein [candidate division KSB1 bacterium]
MKELVVISGKGGTGKTSLVAAFCALEQNVAIADCDVDAADLHLVLNPEIKTTGIFSGGDTAVIDPDQCNGCGECYTQCHFDAILRIEKNGAQFLGMIPYDKKITEAQVKGLSVIKHTDEPMSLMIQSVWKRIRAKF